MRSVYWVWRRELHVMLRAPIVYLVGGLFLAVQGIAFAGLVGALSDPRRPAPLGTLLEAQLAGTLLTWILQLVVLALLGMRAIAEDKRAGTWELLLTAQVGERAAVVGKWAAAATLYALLWIPTLAYLAVVAHYRADGGGFDVAQIAVGYLGAMALGAALLAWVIAASAATSSTLIAGALGFAALVAVFLVGELPALWPELANDHPSIATVLAEVSPRTHLAALARGEVRRDTIVAIVGCALVGLSAATWAACWGRRRKRELRLRAVATLGLAGIVVALGALAVRHPRTWDASADRRNTLDAGTRALLADLPPARLTIVAPTLAGLEPVYDEVARVAARMMVEAPALAVSRSDPATAPGGLAAVARAAGLQPKDLASGGAVIVDAGARREVVDVFALATLDRVEGEGVVVERVAIEQAIAGALARVTRPIPVTACVTSGHGELPLAHADGDKDLAVVAARLAADGVTLETLPPETRDVPARCGVVIVAGPTAPLAGDEALAIQAHLAAGRGAIVMAASRPVQTGDAAGGLAATGLEGVLATDGLGLPRAIAIDPDASVREIPGAIVVFTGYADHAIDAGFQGVRATIWFQPRAVVIDGGARALVRASPASWGERDLEHAPAKGPDDLAGPIVLAAIGSTHRVLAIGSAESLSTAVLGGGASAGDLWFARAVRWAAGGDGATSAAARTPEQVRLVMTDGQRRSAIALCVGGIPLAWLALGGLVVLVRRRAARVRDDARSA